jgi:hypothetical protein
LARQIGVTREPIVVRRTVWDDFHNWLILSA